MPTGTDAYFRCRKCSHKYGGLWRIPDHLQAGIRRTGRTKVVKPRGRIRGGTAHEYTCPCGHTGWSKHFAIEKEIALSPPSESPKDVELRFKLEKDGTP